MTADGGDGQRWWRREGSAHDGFDYLKLDGSPLRSESARSRVESLAIPPAWTDVHISPDANRKIQAWGRDSAGRKQYIYDPEYVKRREDRKWRRVLRYARAVPRLRRATNRHLQGDALDRDKVLATVVRLMSRAYFRVGSERYTVRNRTFGICTLRKEHLEIRGNDLVFTYEGKRRKDQRRVVADTPLVEIIGELLEFGGERLFRYRGDDGETHNVTARAVNRYLRDVLGERYTSKDLRTFGGTVRAATILADLGPPDDDRDAKKNCLICCRLVASELGNTPAICRNAYIHPAVLREYEDAGRTIDPLMERTPRVVAAETPVDYYPEELGLMRFLERYG